MGSFDVMASLDLASLICLPQPHIDSRTIIDLAHLTKRAVEEVWFVAWRLCWGLLSLVSSFMDGASRSCSVSSRGGAAGAGRPSMASRSVSRPDAEPPTTNS